MRVERLRQRAAFFSQPSTLNSQLSHMTPLLRKLLGMNWLLFAAVVVIALAGILFIHGASYLHPTERYWQQQAKWVGIGMVVFFVVTLTDYRWVKWLAVPM